METKEQLVNLIREWISTDNDILKIQKLLKSKKEEKKQQSEQLLQVMKTNEIDCFDINNGKLMYSTVKTKQAVSKKFLLETLNEYFKDQPEIAQDVTTHILDSRGEQIKEHIRRKGNK